jgi:hypothetical protein
VYHEDAIEEHARMSPIMIRAAVGAMLSIAFASSAANSGWSCAELSSEVARLTAAKDALQRSFFDVPGTQAAAIGATSFTPLAYPAVAYLALVGATRIPEPSRRDAVQSQIDLLRGELGRAQCYLEPLYHY